MKNFSLTRIWRNKVILSLVKSITTPVFSHSQVTIQFHEFQSHRTSQPLHFLQQMTFFARFAHTHNKCDETLLPWKHKNSGVFFKTKIKFWYLSEQTAINTGETFNKTHSACCETSTWKQFRHGNHRELKITWRVPMTSGRVMTQMNWRIKWCDVELQRRPLDDVMIW